MATCSDDTWIYWTTTGDTTICTITIDYTHLDTWTIWSNNTSKESREERRAREVQVEIELIEREQAHKEAEELKHKAELTAQELLADLISEDEMEVYKKTGRVLVKGTQHDYILTKGFQAGVTRIEKGKIVDLKTYRGKLKGTAFCVHPVDQHKIPDTDKIISMKIALEAEEHKIMKCANSRGEHELNLAVGM